MMAATQAELRYRIRPREVIPGPLEQTQARTHRLSANRAMCRIPCGQRRWRYPRGVPFPLHVAYMELLLSYDKRSGCISARRWAAGNRAARSSGERTCPSYHDPERRVHLIRGYTAPNIKTFQQSVCDSAVQVQ